MKNAKITRKITQGMYILTTEGGGCVVDAVARVGGSEQPLIAVAVAKANHSNGLLKQNQKFALSILGRETDPELIQTFGFKSGRDTEKIGAVKTREVEGVPVIEASLGYMVMEKVDAIENETHTLFIGKMIEGDVFEEEGQPLTYAEYQERKEEFSGAALGAKKGDATKGDSKKEELAKTTSEQGKTAWVCTACGYVYYGEEVPDDYRCPLCGLGKEFFKKQ